MNVGGVHLGSVSADELDAVLAAARKAALTYDHVGSTLPNADDRRARARQVTIGTGSAAFESARLALATWVPQRALGAFIVPDDAPVAVGTTVLIVLRRGPLYVIAADRVVAVVDEPRRYGYAYGTLPGHPERGEESFVIDHHPDDSVTATIRVDARAATRVGAVASPILRWLQGAALRRYLVALVVERAPEERARRHRRAM